MVYTKETRRVEQAVTRVYTWRYGKGAALEAVAPDLLPVASSLAHYPRPTPLLSVLPEAWFEQCMSWREDRNTTTGQPAFAVTASSTVTASTAEWIFSSSAAKTLEFILMLSNWNEWWCEKNGLFSWKHDDSSVAVTTTMPRDDGGACNEHLALETSWGMLA
jgi:hypothetical protein